MPHAPSASRRALALIQAAFFLLTVCVAPAIHGKLCDDVCALRHADSTGQPAGAHSCCHSQQQGAKRDCQCLGDCCSMHAWGVTPETPHDLAPPSALAPTDPPAAEEAPRDPGAWRLPYPTGPPRTA
ncbi:MAG: hypothetical protein ACM3PF_10370 [Bacteroidota bacterium]